MMTPYLLVRPRADNYCGPLHTDGSVGDPNIYLGAKLRKATPENGVEAWSMSPSKHVQKKPCRMLRSVFRKRNLVDHG
jgi:hypothetical protein